MNKEDNYIQNSIGRIIGIASGMAFGANLLGLKGVELHYNHNERSINMLEKEVRKLAKYLKRLQTRAVIENE